jgi:hypothetical protein
VKHYEQGVTKLISGFQAQAEAAKRRAREKEEKLYMLRKSVSQLLRSIGNVRTIYQSLAMLYCSGGMSF